MRGIKHVILQLDGLRVRQLPSLYNGNKSERLGLSSREIRLVQSSIWPSHRSPNCSSCMILTTSCHHGWRYVG